MHRPLSTSAGRRFGLRTGAVIGSVISLVTATFVLGLADRGSAAVSVGGAPHVPSSGLLFGTTEDGTSSTLGTMESKLGRSLAISRVFSLWDDAQPASAVTSNLNAGRVPLISIMPKRRNGSKVSWASIANGSRDSDITRQATQLRDIGRPVMLAFHHEANLASGYGTPADFRAAFRHYVSVMRAHGTTNVSFVLILSPHTTYSDWYPGSAYVDWVGTDAYNFGVCTPTRPAWHSLQYIAQPFYDWASTTGKPVVLAEWGVPNDPSDPGRRAQYISAAGQTLAAWTNVKAAIYFDEVGSCDWRLGGSVSAMSAFTTLAHSSLANGRPTAEVLPAATIGAAPLSTTLNLGHSTGGNSKTGTGIASWSLSFGDGTSTSGKGMPGTVKHTYKGGTWTIALSVTDTGGRIAATTTSIVAAAAPTVNEGSPIAATTSTSTVPSWVQTNSLTGSYYIEWGTTTGYGHRTAVAKLPGKTFQQSVHVLLSGLTKGVKYHWRGVASTAAGTRTGVDSTFRQ